METLYRGIFTPLITPVDSDEVPDLRSLARLVAFQIENRVHGLWAMGTSSEFASFTEDERAAAIETVVDTAQGAVPIIANVSDASTRLAIRHGIRARSAGVTAIAATPPYYFPHSQDEVTAHYRAIRNAVDLPLFIYNIPQTVRVRVELSTARSLAQEGVVAGIKDSQNDLEWFRQLAGFVHQRNIPFALFAGTRYLIDAGLLAGGDGAIPSIANAFPDLCVKTYELALEGRYQEAADVEAEIIALESAGAALTSGSKNAGVLGLLKAVLRERGVIDQAGLTMPLRTPNTQEVRQMLDNVKQSQQPQTLEAPANVD